MARADRLGYKHDLHVVGASCGAAVVVVETGEYGDESLRRLVSGAVTIFEQRFMTAVAASHVIVR